MGVEWKWWNVFSKWKQQLRFFLSGEYYEGKLRRINWWCVSKARTKSLDEINKIYNLFENIFKEAMEVKESETAAESLELESYTQDKNKKLLEETD